MKKLDFYLGWFIVFLLSAMLFTVLWGVCARYIMDSPSSWTEELARFFLIWVSMLGAAYVSGKRDHITIDLWPEKLIKKYGKMMDVSVSLVIILFVFAVFIVGGIRYIYVSFKLWQTSAALEIPMGYIYLILPLTGFCVLFYRIGFLIKDLKR
ncbi:TRAP transporter small permease [Zunongwangia sp. SCSIO 43204]|uniref:TRAP-type C4-dicarboxylate transport system, small permease component n=1 Tax=Zunongwangia mangrovi TaxID=1334022 RepID=A0A1I1NCM8_9FLAO|nr:MULTISPECIES: TRAP transporter small permease [Zunongwangia]UAB86316.1 TRAP transporter small permease [Zunongwangia sp. SCSIO 43204]SFC91500.1 TRAP-type C4-dicarboxylate transport system, small permease component [Zunongwangia mangrovi]